MKIIKMSQNKNIILASQSETRAKILQFSGINFFTQASDLNESLLIEEFIKTQDNPSLLVQYLADEKAKFISQKNQNDYVIGGDTILVFQDEIIQKSADMVEAKILLKKLRGQQQILYSAVSVYHQNHHIFQYCDEARLEMFDFSDEFLDNYLHEMGNKILQSVGCAMIEAEGVRLFRKIMGDYWTIMGLPLMPLLNFLRENDLIDR